MGTHFNGLMPKIEYDTHERLAHLCAGECLLGWGYRDLLMDGGGIDLIFFQFTVEGVAADAQAAGGLFFVPAALH